jgi:hypothetical protein
MFCFGNMDTTSARHSLALQLRVMRDEIDGILDDVCVSCEGKSAAEITEIFRRRLIPIVPKFFPDELPNHKSTSLTMSYDDEND